MRFKLENTLFRSGDNIELIVYDMDSVLWPLQDLLASELGVAVEQLDYYRVYDNPKLSQTQKQKAMGIFNDPKFFEQIEFYPGVADILKPREFGVNVQIHSNCGNAEVAAVKLPQLLAAIPGLDADDVILNSLDNGPDLKKEVDARATVLVDDSPHNVAGSPARLNIVPRVAWNTTPRAVELMVGKNVHYVNSLTEANSYIHSILQRCFG